jgi:hypothetical protein
MALPAFSAAKHPIAIGGYGFPLSAYAKRGQENPVSRVAVGSDDFLATDRSSFWTQEDYSGGNYQYEWHDVAMISTSESVSPNQLSHAVRTAPRLVLGKSLNAIGISAVTPSTEAPKAAFTVANRVVFCFQKRFVTATLTSAGITTAIDAHGIVKTCFAYSDEEQLVYAGGADGKIYAFTDTTLSLSKTINNVNEQNATLPGPCQMVAFFGDQLFGCWGQYLYVQMDTGKWRKVNGGSTRPRAGRLAGVPVAACGYNGQLYVLITRPGSFEGSIVATTGTQVNGVADIPYSVQPLCMQEYAGRLYIGCRGFDIDDLQSFGELYELTGTSLRLVRSFTRERFAMGPVTGPVTSLDVADGFLIMPNTSRQGVELYDASNDAFFTGPCLELNSALGQVDTTRVCSVVSSCRDQLLIWFTHATDTTKAGIYRHKLVNVDGANTAGQYGQGCQVTTSDFDPEPARIKQWSKLTVKSRTYPVAKARYSTNGGANWYDLAPPTFQQDGDVYFATFQLTAGTGTQKVPPSRRLRLQFWMLPARSDGFGEFLAHTVSFVFQEHDKHGWQITIPCLYSYEQLDETKAPDTETPAEKMAYLWGLADNGTQVAYRDRNGASYNVVVTQCVESEPVINPSAGRESYFSCYLLEV